MASCSNPACPTKEAAATLSCPNCIKLNMAPCFFCGQDCFKAAWGEHKKLHKLGKALEAARIAKANAAPPPVEPTALPDWARHYSFSGALRPAQQSPTRIVPSRIPRPDYADHPDGASLSEQRDKSSDRAIKVYSGEELERVRHACKMGREVSRPSEARPKRGEARARRGPSEARPERGEVWARSL